jgi:hypothetical protein
MVLCLDLSENWWCMSAYADLLDFFWVDLEAEWLQMA